MSFAFEHLKLRRIILVLCSALDLTELPYPSSNSLPKRPLEFINTLLVRNGMAFMKYSRAGVLTPPQALSWGEGGRKARRISDCITMKFT